MLSITIESLLNDISSKPSITVKITPKIKKSFRYAKSDCFKSPLNSTWKSAALSYDVGIIVFHYGSVHSFCFRNGRQCDRRVFRNVVGLFIFIPMLFKQGLDFVKTDKLWMHTWRSLVGLAAMYGFFYAIANLKLSNAMVFSYSSPIFIPLIAWLFLKEKLPNR